MDDDDVAALRREYADHGLAEADLAADPMTMFGRWFAEAREAGLYEPNAMVVSRSPADGQPSSRMVLLKGVSDEGFVFFTNLRSRKGEELAAEPRCALLFPWHPLERQVRVEGTAAGAAARRRGGVLRHADRAAPGSAPTPRTSRRWWPRAPSSTRRTRRPRRPPRRGARARRVGRLPRPARGRGVLAGPARAGCTTGWSTAARPGLNRLAHRAPGAWVRPALLAAAPRRSGLAAAISRRRPSRTPPGSYSVVGGGGVRGRATS